MNSGMFLTATLSGICHAELAVEPPAHFLPDGELMKAEAAGPGWPTFHWKVLPVHSIPSTSTIRS